MTNLVIGDVALSIWGVKLDEKPTKLEVFNPNFDKIDDFELEIVQFRPEIEYLAKFLAQNPQFMQKVVLKCQNEDIECVVPTLPVLREMLMAEFATSSSDWEKSERVDQILGTKLLGAFKNVYMSQMDL